MKDLFNHQKSMVFGVKKIQRRHCRAFLKDQIPNHILLHTSCHVMLSCYVMLSCNDMSCCNVQSTSCGPSCPRTARPRGLRWGRARPAAARAPCPRAAGRRTWSSREDGWETPSKLCYFTIYLHKAFNQT